MDTGISKNQGDIGMPNYHHPYLVPLVFIHLSSLHHFEFLISFFPDFFMITVSLAVVTA